LTALSQNSGTVKLEISADSYSPKPKVYAKVNCGY